MQDPILSQLVATAVLTLFCHQHNTTALHTQPGSNADLHIFSCDNRHWRSRTGYICLNRLWISYLTLESLRTIKCKPFHARCHA
ncbi:hypothetical protein F5B21DRAFT_490814 [Xylaria acuta]|nr:hypothetical protein F5B21DRAFT_490814 [Xylaria acuta]